MARAFGLALALGCVILPAPLAACRLALVLALDVSSSVDWAEDRLQRQGLVAALRDPDVQAAFLADDRPVALHVFQWSGRRDQALLIPDWALIERAEDLERVAQTIEGSARSRADRPTALGYALGFASRLLEQSPECDFATIDVSGDGISNEGFEPARAYAVFPLDDVTVNGLAIITDEGGLDLVPYYRQEVIRGPGAFVEIAAGFEDFERAMKRKLLAELNVRVIGTAPETGLEPDRWPG
jgi:hypothetical protein